MDALITLWSIKAKNFLRRQRKGAAVLETVLLIVVAVLIIGFIIEKFVNGENSYLTRIFKKVEEIFSAKPVP